MPSLSLILLFNLIIAISIRFALADIENKDEDNIKYDFRDDAEERTRPHYALNYRKARDLALVEEKINVRLWAIIISSHVEHKYQILFDQKCYQSLQTYLNEFRKDSESIGDKSGFLRTKIISENPLLMYKMIRRIYVVLMGEVLKACQVSEDGMNWGIVDTIEEIIEGVKYTLPMPTSEDLNDALLGILRIHYVYGFNAKTELSQGIFQDVKTNVTLNFDECLELGKRAIEINAKVLAYQWLESANSSMERDDMTEGEKQLASIQLEMTWNKLLKITRLKTLKQLHNLLPKHLYQELLHEAFYPYETYATCRGEIDMELNLKCFLNSQKNPYWTIQPLKMEQLHIDPPVWQFHDFIRNEKIANIKHKAQTYYARSGVTAATRTEYSAYRTSMTAWIYDDHESDPGEEIVRLNKRVELCTGFKVIKKGSSHALQVVDYSSLGGHYDFHDDTLSNPLLTKANGDRIATFLMFLSDVPLGGYTAFPKLKIFAKPVKGSAILWYSLYRNGEPDTRHLHGGCPVILGSKTVANKWILQYENMYRYQCSLDPME